ncbi:MAG: hypothetical protein N2662_00115 [Bacteroidales bacterium]|nr:hypothetical protein [Bacteroidales bacterium]
MKKNIAIALPFVFLSFVTDKPITSDCKCKGIPLYGRVQFVEAFEDFRIQFVDGLADIHVKFVDTRPSKCGEWQIVDALPDFKVRVVNGLADFKVKKVDALPGLR